MIPSKIANTYILSLFFCAIFCSTGFAQSIVLQGKILSATTNQPLPFVNVIINGGQAGTTSDLDGKFSVAFQGAIQKVSFSYIGYEAFVYTVNTADDLQPLQRPLTIRLQEKNEVLPEAVISSGANPAHRLIRLAVQNRSRNHPLRIDAFAYESYQKLFITTEQTFEKDSIIASAHDSTDYQMQQHLEKHHLFLMESISERKHIAPNYDYERVTANRVAGLQNPMSLALNSLNQVLHFHEDYLPFMSRNYLNPVSAGSIARYDFQLEETVLLGQDTLFWIAFEPLPQTNFEGLSGRIALNSKGYAIQNIIVRSLDAPKSTHYGFRLEQHYEFVDSTHWFPTQIHSEIILYNTQVAQKRLKGVNITQLQNIKFRPKPRFLAFQDTKIEILPTAAQAPDSVWRKYRADGLNSIERNTYAYLDSLGKRNKFDKTIQVLNYLSFGKVPLGRLDLDLNQLLRVNRYEGLRLGLGFFTSDKVSEWWTAGGYIAFGFKDKSFKYGLSAVFTPFQSVDWQIGASYADDVYEPGNVEFWEERNFLMPNTGRRILTERMDRVRRTNLFMTIRPLQNIRFRVGLASDYLRPKYAYTFQAAGTEPLQDFQLTEFTAQFNWAWESQYLKYGWQRRFIQLKYPVLSVNYGRGLRFLGGEFGYHRLEAKLVYQHLFRNVGKTRLHLQAGQVNGTAPYQVLYHSPGTTRDFPSAIPDYFQTMELYEFLSDRYMYVFLSHHFGQLLYKFRSSFFKPELEILHSMAWGTLQNPQQHVGLGFKTLEQGYWESGFLIHNILRSNYLNAAYFGIGGGIFFRYGANALDTFGRNVFYRLTIDFSF
jgi:hypothetical protein